MGLEGKFQDSCNGRAHTGGSDVTESVTEVSRAGKELVPAQHRIESSADYRCEEKLPSFLVPKLKVPSQGEHVRCKDVKTFYYTSPTSKGMANQDQAPEFKLNSCSDKFADKTKDVFGYLSVLEVKHEAHQKAHQTSYENLLKKDPNEEDTRTIEKTAQYKHCGEKCDVRINKPYNHSQIRGYGRPRHSQHQNRDFRCPPKKLSCHSGHRRGTPDYKVHPERWTPYSLDDVSNTDMSDSSNTQAAFKFLDERKKMRELEAHSEEASPANLEETACSRMAIKFVKRQDRKGQRIETQGSTSRQKEVVVLPVVEEIENEDEVAECSEKIKDDKVSFKRKKGNKKNIRSRPGEEEVKYDQEG
ncbi:protein TSSC4-like [Haliotis rufescens]|uniref:protein TSSC4-like n=1 Tax=Haliotis rufescens TaxID=6454 RepID=UPI001EAFF264|nr:protein TSSC4-like [Haliotis rufescens]